MIPRATYRLQFHAGFTFKDGGRLAPYLARLGISHVYASPIQTARKGSKHGYDLIDHAVINPELGGESGFREMAGNLRAHGLGIILDIVPNHMAVGGASNKWWLDVLEHGQSSSFAGHFDIDWAPPDPLLSGKIFVPFLGEPYDDVLRSGALKLVYDPVLAKLAFAYHDHRFPLRPDHAATVARGNTPSDADLSIWNTPEGLHSLLERQHFVLGWWRTATDRINWRRFFDITELAAIRVERDEVFEAVHALPLALYADGLVDGFRIDHVDGLADPGSYCRMLRARLNAVASARNIARAYIVVEKILARREALPRDWDTDGTTGYDFLAQISELQQASGSAALFRRYWRELSGRSDNFEDEERAGRREVLPSFESQLLQTAAQFSDIGGSEAQQHDFSRPLLKRAIARLITELRCYRVYAADEAAQQASSLENAIDRAGEKSAPDERRAIVFVGNVLRLSSHLPADRTRDCARRFNQLASAVAAKGVEDTAFYRYGVLSSRNDVGSDPRYFASSPDEFHHACARRQHDFPHAMLATATHDTKRGEDARARLAATSEIPDAFRTKVNQWMSLTAHARSHRVENSEVYLFFQALVGAWPLTLGPDDHAGLGQLCERLTAWRLKSLREAKLKTSWVQPDEDYESAHVQFVRTSLDPARSRDFLSSVADFVSAISSPGCANSLVQTTLRLTLPGVPDTYQGTEFWDFSLVDPDNRRPVDFDTREGLFEPGARLEALVKTWRDGRIKQALIARILKHRTANPELYAEGDYRPLAVEGEQRANVIAFVRSIGPHFLVVVAARLFAEAILGTERLAPHTEWWGETRIVLGDLRDASCSSMFGDPALTRLPENLTLKTAIRMMPVALIVGRKDDRC